MLVTWPHQSQTPNAERQRDVETVIGVVFVIGSQPAPLLEAEDQEAFHRAAAFRARAFALIWGATNREPTASPDSRRSRWLRWQPSA